MPTGHFFALDLFALFLVPNERKKPRMAEQPTQRLSIVGFAHRCTFEHKLKV
jgi:hypothetical protein